MMAADCESVRAERRITWSSSGWNRRGRERQQPSDTKMQRHRKRDQSPFTWSNPGRIWMTKPTTDNAATANAKPARYEEIRVVWRAGDVPTTDQANQQRNCDNEGERAQLKKFSFR